MTLGPLVQAGVKAMRMGKSLLGGACRRRTGNHQPGGQAGVRGEEQKGCGDHRSLGLGWGRAREKAQACAVPTASCVFDEPEAWARPFLAAQRGKRGCRAGGRW